MSDIHEFVAKLKDLALQLNKTPTKAEALLHGVIGDYQLARIGGYMVLVKAAGLTQNRATKITNSIFNVNIDSHLEDHREYVEQTFVKKSKNNSKFAIMPDMHEPFAHPNVKQDFKLFVEKFQPDYIIQVGDAFDMFSHGKFPRSHNIFTPKEEETSAKKNLTEFWDEMRKASPNSKCVQMVGNHDVRPLKRTIESVPTIEHWVEKYFAELMTFDGVQTILDPREEFIVDGIVFHHGYRTKLGDQRNHLLMNSVGGHSHRGGVVFRNIRNEILWELNCGLAGDPTAKGLSYTNQKINEWTLGFGAIDNYGPRFIPV